MRFLIFICIAVYFTLVPQPVYAMDTGIRFTASGESWTGEVWYDHTLLWQLIFCRSEALPASTPTDYALYRTCLFPEFKNGLLVLRINP